MLFLHYNKHQSTKEPNQPHFFALSQKSGAGFSLLEVLITAAIIGILTSIMVIKYSVFDSAVLLKSQAFEIALDLRETQIFAISVRGQTTTFREEYGLHFDLDAESQYIFFQDNGTDEPAEYDASPADEAIGAPRIIDSRFKIKDLCVIHNTGSDCASSGSGNIRSIDITFKRPDFDAKFCVKNPSLNNCWQSSNISEVSIIISPLSNLASERTITITSTGQISVD